MKISLREYEGRIILDVTAQTLQDRSETRRLIETLRKGKEVRMHVRYDIPPIEMDDLIIMQAKEK
jgi:hypothetical protein